MTNICETATQLWDILNPKQRAGLVIGASIVGLIVGFWLLDANQHAESYNSSTISV